MILKNRILIKEDQNNFKEIVSDLQDFLPGLDKLKQAFEALDLGPLTAAHFETMKSFGTKPIITEYLNILNGQLDSLKITSSLIRANAIADHNKTIDNLKIALAEVKSYRPKSYAVSRNARLSLEYISYRPLGFYISASDKEIILEKYCRVYLETETEKFIYDKLKNLELAYNEYNEIISQCIGANVNRNSFNGLFAVLQMDLDNYTASLNPTAVKFISSHLRNGSLNKNRKNHDL